MYTKRLLDLADLKYPRIRWVYIIIFALLAIAGTIWFVRRGAADDQVNNLAPTIGGEDMADIPKPPALKLKKGERPRTSLHVPANVQDVRKLIASGTREDHPAIEIARRGSKQREIGGHDAR